MDFSFISTPFFDIVLYLSAPLVLVIFDNPSIRKRVSCKSKGINFSKFSTCFVGFVPSLFFLRFSLIFDAILCSVWHQFWEKNPSENRFKKRCPLVSNDSLWPWPGAPWQPPSRAHFSNKKQLFELEMLFEFVSMPLVSKKLHGNGFLSWFRLQMFQKKSKKWKGSMYYAEGFAPDDLTRPGQRPGESIFGEARTPQTILESIWEHPGKILSLHIWHSKISKILELIHIAT